jgi:T5SS/PEP-CTERM-associated repeat protein
VAIVAALAPAELARAVVSSAGSNSPMLPTGNPGGGNLVGPVTIGDNGVGSLTITSAGQSTPSAINVTSGNIVVGTSGSGPAVGLLTLADLGSAMTTNGNADMIIGNSGAGSVQASNMARFNISDDILLGVSAGASGTLLLTGLGTIAALGDDVVSGAAGEGLIQMTSSARLFADAATFGQSSGSDGRGTVSGFDTLWRQSGAITVGDAGRGEFQVISQAAAVTGNLSIGSAATGVGVAVVNGAGTIWEVSGAVTVGAAGHGTLNVLEGAQFSNTGAARFATADGSEAHVIISGVNALWEVGTTLNVGEMGFATLDVRSGARLVAGDTVIGDNTDSRGEVIVEGRGSVLEVNGTLDVSDPGEADLTIANSGLVTAQGVVRIAVGGRLSMVSGRLEAGSTGVLNNGLLQGSGRILGAVNNTANGKIRTRLGEVLVLANNLVNSGVVELDGGELETTGPLTNNADIDAQAAIVRAGGGLQNNAGAQLSITGGTVDVFGTVTNAAGGIVAVGGNSTAVFHDALNNSGQFTVFEGSDVLALENLTFTPTSALSVQLGLVDETEEFGQIDAAGDAALAGSLAVTLAPGFTPTLGDSFQLLTAGSVTGAFANASLPPLGAGLAWDVDYTPESVILSVESGGAGLTADFNNDGKVDAADLARWRTGFGKTTGAVRGDGDADGDGDTDGADFLAWQRQLGRTPAVAAVPEPCGAILAGLALLAALGIRRRRASF